MVEKIVSTLLFFNVYFFQFQVAAVGQQARTENEGLALGACHKLCETTGQTETGIHQYGIKGEHKGIGAVEQVELIGLPGVVRSSLVSYRD
jgi:hypothetical protein